MKNLIKLMLITGFAFSAWSCEEEEPVEIITPATPIVFDDNIDKFSGTYFVGGTTSIKVSVGSNVSSINVSSRYTPAGGSAKIYSLGSIPVSNGEATFSLPSRSLFDPADEQDNSATLAAGKIRPTGNFTLIFDAVLNDGGVERKYYTATIANNIAFSAFNANAPLVNPTTSFNDSTYRLRFTLQNPASARITNVKVFRKLGAAAEEATPIIDKNYAADTETIADEFVFQFPSQAQIPAYSGANFAAATLANRTVTHRFVVTTAIGNTNSFTAFNVANTPVPLPFTRTLTDLTPNTIWDLGTRFTATSEETADLKFVTSGTGFTKTLDLTVGAGNTSDFVRLNSLFNYAGASYNSVRDAYNAGAKLTTVADLAVGDVIIVNVGDIADTSRTNLKVLRITNVRRDAVGSADRLTIEYKSVN
jgi:hypothetical protein